MTTEEKFNAAVNVIRNLPKNGAFQPSQDLQLKFYSYFKQASEGPCDKPRPPFWQPIERFKWDAWKRLGNMPKHEAMNNYVEELKKIVETMSYNDNVETFLGSLGSFYDSVPVEDIEMLLGPVLERVRSQPGSPLHGSPFGSRETSPTRLPRELVSKMSSLETSPLSSMSPSPQPPDTDDEDEEFIDTVETTPHTGRKFSRSLSNSPVVSKRNIDLIENSNSKDKNSSKANGHVTNASPLSYSNHNGTAPQINGNGLIKNEVEENVTVNGTKSRNSRDRESPNVAKRRVVKQNGGPRPNNNAYVTDLSEPIREAVLHLQKDLDRITARVRSLEVSTLSQPQANAVVKKHPRWWPFPELSPRTAFFVIIWPFVAHYLIRNMQNRRRRY